MAYIKENIDSILNSISSDISLVCVSKTRSVEEIGQVYDLGIRDFGENKVQEIMNKYEAFPDAKWHLIGHLQRNKVKYIVGKVFLIQSLDSFELLREIEKRYSKESKIANCLIQINIGKETSKTGLFIEELNSFIEQIECCSNVKVKGLMAIIPKCSEIQTREYFNSMKVAYDKLKSVSYKNISMEYLSMGMSGDYNIAIDEGSNMIRIGEGIFGKRMK